MARPTRRHRPAWVIPAAVASVVLLVLSTALILVPLGDDGGRTPLPGLPEEPVDVRALVEVLDRADAAVAAVAGADVVRDEQRARLEPWAQVPADALEPLGVERQDVFTDAGAQAYYDLTFRSTAGGPTWSVYGVEFEDEAGAARALEWSRTREFTELAPAEGVDVTGGFARQGTRAVGGQEVLWSEAGAPVGRVAVWVSAFEAPPGGGPERAGQVADVLRRITAAGPAAATP